MTYTSTTTIEEPIIYPSVALCITMDRNFYNPMNMDWMESEKYNFSFPFDDFGMVEDIFPNM